MKRRTLLGVLVPVLLAPGTAGAAVLTYRLSGFVTEVVDPANIFGATPGSPFTSTYAIDPTAPDNDPLPDIGRYAPDVFLTDFPKASIYGFLSSVFLAKSSERDFFSAGESDFEHRGLQDVHVELIELVLEDFDRRAFESGDHPVIPPPIEEFEVRRMFLWGWEPGFQNTFQITGEITSWSLVPEPSSLWTLLAGGVLVGGTSRRRSVERSWTR